MVKKLMLEFGCKTGNFQLELMCALLSYVEQPHWFTNPSTKWSIPNIRCTRLHELNPSLQLRPPPGLHRREASLLCRLWLGTAFTKACITLIGMTDTAACDVCGAEENIEHLL